jgi:hypothetical protein
MVTIHDWSSVHASWNFIDPESPIIDYTWAIGIIIITISLVITDTANNGLWFFNRLFISVLTLGWDLTNRFKSATF